MTTIELKTNVIGVRHMAKLVRPGSSIYRWVEPVDQHGDAIGAAGSEWTVEPGTEEYSELIGFFKEANQG